LLCRRLRQLLIYTSIILLGASREWSLWSVVSDGLMFGYRAAYRRAQRSSLQLGRRVHSHLTLNDFHFDDPSELSHMALSPNSTWLVMSRLNTRRHVRRVERVELVVSIMSSLAVRQARHIQNAWARHVERVVSCRDVTLQAKWNLGFTEDDNTVDIVLALFI